MERQLVLDLKDIGRVGITCPDCSTQTIVDITKLETSTPFVCGSCNKDFYPNRARGSSPLERLVATLRDCTREPKPRITLHLPAEPLKA